MIDLSLFDLPALQSLHLTYLHFIETHQNVLDENDGLENPDPLLRYVLSEKIKMYENKIALVKRKIELMASEKLRYSVETLFFLFGFTKMVIQVHFLTTSEAFKNYGPYVTGVIIYSKTEIYKLLQQYKDGINSDGLIHFECLHSDLSKELKSELKTNGFRASEISHID